jgi:hypothetical protein
VSVSIVIKNVNLLEILLIGVVVVVCEEELALCSSRRVKVIIVFCVLKMKLYLSSEWKRLMKVVIVVLCV